MGENGAVPLRKGLLHYAAALLLWLARWRPSGPVPDLPKFVFIAAPHTTQWDGFIMVAISCWYGVRIKFLMKKQMFRFPFGTFMKLCGGIPVDRAKNNDLVGHMGKMLRDADHLHLGVPPEGTRSKRELWKSGFYHAARLGEVPVVLGFLDYPKKRGGFGPVIHLTDDMTADMDKIRAFYNAEMGLYPELYTEPLLRAELPVEEPVEADPS